MNETLAVEAQIMALYKMGYTPWSETVYKARQYAWQHQLNGVTGDSASQNEFRMKLLQKSFF